MAEINFLAISVGNTRTRLGAFIDDKLVDSTTLRNEREDELGDALERTFDPMRERETSLVLMSSVNVAVADRIAAQVSRRLDREIKRVERDVAIPIGRQLDREAIVGEDRLLNAAAAFDVLQQACVVVDAGTAITVDFVDGAGTFHGGAIAPGGQLMLDGLAKRTAALPEVEFNTPVEPVGHNTAEAMKSGVFHGLRGMVRELVEQYAQQVGQYPLVVATGGDSDLLFRDYSLIDRVVPDLTLMGLAVTLRKATQESSES